MSSEFKVPLIELSMALSSAIDLVSQTVANHHKRVAYIATSLGKELELPIDRLHQLLIAGVLHDIGALSLHERIDLLNFEYASPHKHAEMGYRFLINFEPFAGLANTVRFHHLAWQNGKGAFFKDTEVPLEAHILHLADRVEVLIQKDKEILSQTENIREKIDKHRGVTFVPDFVDTFNKLSTKEYFWLDLEGQNIDYILYNKIRGSVLELDLDGLLKLAKLFSQIIDFRSRFTANHSSGVAASGVALAKLVGFSEKELILIQIAGYLHDLGKLAVPTEILEKKGPLTDAEFEIVRKHTYHTYRIIENISELKVINEWAAYHHERLDGSGYPFHIPASTIPLGSRIIAVADVFTALTEDRPYRPGMDREKTVKILNGLGEDGALDKNIVRLLEENFDSIEQARKEAQEASGQEYLFFDKHLQEV